MSFEKGHVPHNKGQKNAGAPAVKIDRSGHRLRLRNLDYPLEGCISTRAGETRYRLEPNKWTEVPDEVYNMLKSKFMTPSESESPDWNGDPSNPQRFTRTETHSEYIIEGFDDK